MVTPVSVKAARKAFGWSQQELANRAGVQLETLAHFEAGRKAGAKTVDAIASALDRAHLEFGRPDFGKSIKSPDGPGDGDTG